MICISFCYFHVEKLKKKKKKNCDGMMAWYKGTVLSYDESTREYRIAYDNEDEIFSFPLLEDLENNDLQFY